MAGFYEVKGKIKPLKGHIPYEGGKIIRSDITTDLRGLKGNWECGNCGFKKNRFDTMRKKLTTQCDRCFCECTLDIQGHLDKYPDVKD